MMLSWLPWLPWWRHQHCEISKKKTEPNWRWPTLFTREEILKELAKEAAAVYTTEWLERLDANGELEEGQLEPPEGPSPALEEREPSGEEVIAAAAEVAATIAAAAAEIVVAAAAAAAAAAATAAATATAHAPSE